MKNKIRLTILLAALLLPAMSQFASATEPDTIWTIGARGECWFTPDGTKILVKPNQCLNTSDGSVIWDYKDSVNGFSPNGYFSEDSLYFYDTDFDKYRISDGAKVATKPDFTFDTIPDFFIEGWYWTEARNWTNGSKLMLPDENTFYYLYYQDSLDIDQKKVGSRSLLCKYDRVLDSIVLFKPLLLNGDTNIRNKDIGYGNAEIIGYVSQNNTVLVRFYDDSTYRQYSATTLDSVSQFIYDRKKYGWVNEHKISYNGKYLGMGTSDGESKLGWIIIYDLTNNSMYNKFLERDSTARDHVAWNIAFSRNDSFLVSTSDMLRESRTKTWNFHSGTLIQTYDYDYIGTKSLDVSPDNTKIIEPVARRTSLLRARWTPVTSVEEESEAPEMMLVYPNPGTDDVTIDLTNHTPKVLVESVRVYDIQGIEHPVSYAATPLSEGNLRFNVTSLPSGEYIIVIEGREKKFSRKLIINR